MKINDYEVSDSGGEICLGSILHKLNLLWSEPAITVII